MALRTDYKDDILDLTQNTQRKYRMITNADGTVSFEDATVYSQVGDSFGASQLNEIANAVTSTKGNIDYDIPTDWVQLKGEDGEWHNWKTGNLKTLYIFKDGEVDFDITGGIGEYATRLEGGYPVVAGCLNFKIIDDYISINNTTTNSSSTVRPALSIDITNYNKMYILFKFIDSLGGDGLYIGVTTSAENNYEADAYTLINSSVTSDTAVVYEVDISQLTGYYYPFIYPDKNNAIFGISAISFR